MGPCQRQLLHQSLSIEDAGSSPGEVLNREPISASLLRASDSDNVMKRDARSHSE